MNTPMFARVIRERREREGHTQATLAVLIGASLSSVAQWEAGKHTPSYWSALRLKAALGGHQSDYRLVEAPPEVETAAE